MLSQAELEKIPRSELVERARELGVERPERMTRVELRDEMIRRTVSQDEQADARGLFGVARSMLASVVETGLNLPDAAKVIRGDSNLELPAGAQTPVATVTLAEIYAAQGHKSRALRMLDEVLLEEPGHVEALRVRRELTSDDRTPKKEVDDGLESSRQEATLDAPTVAPSVAQDYVPGGFVDTTGEEIRTGQPPSVEESLDVQKGAGNGEQPGTSTAAGSDTASPTTPETEGSMSTTTAHEAPDLPPVLILAQNDLALNVYWELPTRALEHCGVNLDEGDAALRLVAFSPSGPKPSRSERTVLLSAISNPVTSSDATLGAGALRLNELGEPIAVRAALGWATEDGFLPLCVGRTVEEWGADSQGHSLLMRATPYL